MPQSSNSNFTIHSYIARYQWEDAGQNFLRSLNLPIVVLTASPLGVAAWTVRED